MLCATFYNFLSFLRKQVSTVSSGTRWIPAFAGMTEKNWHTALIFYQSSPFLEMKKLAHL
jgi:hypothetical protein